MNLGTLGLLSLTAALAALAGCAANATTDDAEMNAAAQTLLPVECHSTTSAIGNGNFELLPYSASDGSAGTKILYEYSSNFYSAQETSGSNRISRELRFPGRSLLDVKYLLENDPEILGIALSTHEIPLADLGLECSTTRPEALEPPPAGPRCDGKGPELGRSTFVVESHRDFGGNVGSRIAFTTTKLHDVTVRGNAFINVLTRALWLDGTVPEAAALLETDPEVFRALDTGLTLEMVALVCE